MVLSTSVSSAEYTGTATLNSARDSASHWTVAMSEVRPLLIWNMCVSTVLLLPMAYSLELVLALRSLVCSPRAA